MSWRRPLYCIKCHQHIYEADKCVEIVSDYSCICGCETLAVVKMLESEEMDEWWEAYRLEGERRRAEQEARRRELARCEANWYLGSHG